MTAQLSRNFKKAQSPHAVALKQTAEQKGDSRLHLRPRPAYMCTLQYAALRYTENDSEPANRMKQPRHADTCWYYMPANYYRYYIYKFRVNMQGHNGARKEL